MNEQNYATREASQRLQDAGIVLETEAVWFFSTTGWELIGRYKEHPVNKHYLPAPSMAEVWRELPNGMLHKGEWHRLYISKCKSSMDTFTEYAKDEQAICGSVKRNPNPTDALIYLLIWVRKEKP